MRCGRGVRKVDVMLLTIDPGKKSVGWAEFSDKKLSNCGLVSVTWHDLLGQIPCMYITHIVIEVPQVYQQRLLKGDPNYLIDVSLVAGGIAARSGLRKPEFIRPRVWKGNVPKDIMTKRIVDHMDADEFDIFEAIDVPKGLQHNVLDAIGIGLWKVGRL